MNDEQFFGIDKSSLDACYETWAELLQRPELPHQFRVLLNIFMSDSRDDDLDLSSAYIRRALAVVVWIEKLKLGVELPACALIETQLQWIKNHTTKSTNVMTQASATASDAQLWFAFHTGPSEGSTRTTIANTAGTESFTESPTSQPSSAWLERFPIVEGKTSDGKSTGDTKDNVTVEQ